MKNFFLLFLVFSSLSIQANDYKLGEEISIEDYNAMPNSMFNRWYIQSINTQLHFSHRGKSTLDRGFLEKFPTHLLILNHTTGRVISPRGGFEFPDGTVQITAQLKGEKGDKGDKGNRGDKGNPGPRGKKGDLGPKGKTPDKVVISCISNQYDYNLDCGIGATKLACITRDGYIKTKKNTCEANGNYTVCACMHSQ